METTTALSSNLLELIWIHVDDIELIAWGMNGADDIDNDAEEFRIEVD
jgi:hypothetical protein